MVAMFGAMAVLRRIDQEEPLVLLYARVGYLLYIAVTSVLYCLLHFRIVALRDMTLITVPLVQKAPSFSQAMEKARKAAEKAEAEKRGELIGNDDDDDESTTTTTTTTNNADDDSKDGDGEENSAVSENKTETITVMEYDLRHLSSARRSWATSSCFLAAVHYHMQSVSPLAMAAIMGIIRLLTEEPLVQIHLRGTPAVDKLARPFTPEKNPLATMLKDISPKDDESSTTSTTTTSTTTATTTTGRVQNGQGPNDDLHDDGDDDDDDDDTPVMSTNIRDDHIKSDFDDDGTPEVSEQTKKAQ